jgi:DNA-binding MarR family transcriptional regulator
MKKSRRGPDDARATALAGALRGVVGKLRRRLREHSPTGELTWSQVSVLGHLEREGPATVTRLARAEGVRPQSMGATVSALEAAGLVLGSPDPGDGRQTIWSLTPVSRQWVASFRAAREDWLFGAIRARLSKAEQEELLRAVGLLERLVDA